MAERPVTRHRHPSAPVVVVVAPGCDHGLHLALALLTCSWWIPVWAICAACNPRRVVVIDLCELLPE